jgi:hypothetical protein
MFVLVHIATATFDSDWHRTYSTAEAHALRCGLGADWYVCEFSDAQCDQLFRSTRSDSSVGVLL